MYPGIVSKSGWTTLSAKMFTVPKETVLQKEARLLAISRRKRAKAKKIRLNVAAQTFGVSSPHDDQHLH